MIAGILMGMLILTVLGACFLLEACYEPREWAWLVGAGGCFIGTLVCVWALWALS